MKSSGDFHDDVTDGIKALERGEGVDATPTLLFTSYELMETLTPRVLDLIKAIHREEPSSINHTARVVDRDVKNVYGELNRLAQLGIIFFEDEGQNKRPVVWFDELTIHLLHSAYLAYKCRNFLSLLGGKRWPQIPIG